MDRQFRHRRVEPNSSLGKAFQYMLNHFEKLSRFLSAPGTPIDNNEAVGMRNKEEARRNPAAFLPWNYPREEAGEGALSRAA